MAQTLLVTPGCGQTRARSGAETEADTLHDARAEFDAKTRARATGILIYFAFLRTAPDGLNRAADQMSSIDTFATPSHPAA